jgi:hypothetical protein
MKPGSIICCIDDGDWSQDSQQLFPNLQKKDHLYVVRRAIPNWTNPKGPEGIALQEIFGDWSTFKTYSGQTIFEEYHFIKNRFRELPFCRTFSKRHKYKHL